MWKATSAISLVLYGLLLCGAGFYLPDAPALDWHAYAPAKPAVRHKHD